MIRRDLNLLGYFFVWALGITAAGAVLGVIIFPLVGLVFDTGYTPLQLMMNGAKTLGFYFMVWAPGIGIVACVMREYRRKHPDAERKN